MRRVPSCCLILAAVLCATGCGDIAFKTRYLPKASQLSWDDEHEQLPWRPPSVGESHMARSGKGHIPHYPYMLEYDIDLGVHGYHYDGDGDAADSGEWEPLEFD